MIDWIKENYIWIGALVIPIVVALIRAHAKKSDNSVGRNQKIGGVNGSNNVFVNGDINKK